MTTRDQAMQLAFELASDLKKTFNIESHAFNAGYVGKQFMAKSASDWGGDIQPGQLGIYLGVGLDAVANKTVADSMPKSVTAKDGQVIPVVYYSSGQAQAYGW